MEEQVDGGVQQGMFQRNSVCFMWYKRQVQDHERFL